MDTPKPSGKTRAQAAERLAKECVGILMRELNGGLPLWRFLYEPILAALPQAQAPAPRGLLSYFPNDRILDQMEREGLKLCQASFVPIAEVRRLRAGAQAPAPAWQPIEELLRAAGDVVGLTGIFGRDRFAVNVPMEMWSRLGAAHEACRRLLADPPAAGSAEEK